MGPQTISLSKWNCYGCHTIILKLNHFTTKMKQLNNNTTNLSQETVSNFTTKMKLPSMQEHYPNIRCRNTIQTSRRLSPTTHWCCMPKSPVRVSSNSDICYRFAKTGEQTRHYEPSRLMKETTETHKLFQDQDLRQRRHENTIPSRREKRRNQTSDGTLSGGAFKDFPSQ